MSRQKQNFLWLMIVCCVTCQITCSKIMIIGDTLTNTCFWSCNRSICPAINVTCPPTHEILIGDFCIMNVNQNTSILGHCKSSTGETYSFKITNDGGKYEVRMNETVNNISMWFFPNESKCLPSEVLNSTGSTSSHTEACQTHAKTNPNTTTTNPNTTTSKTITTATTITNPNTTTKTTTITAANPNTTTTETTITTANPNTTTTETTTITAANPNTTTTENTTITDPNTTTTETTITTANPNTTTTKTTTITAANPNTTTTKTTTITTANPNTTTTKTTTITTANPNTTTTKTTTITTANPNTTTTETTTITAANPNTTTTENTTITDPNTTTTETTITTANPNTTTTETTTITTANPNTTTTETTTITAANPNTTTTENTTITDPNTTTTETTITTANPNTTTTKTTTITAANPNTTTTKTTTITTANPNTTTTKTTTITTANPNTTTTKTTTITTANPNTTTTETTTITAANPNTTTTENTTITDPNTTTTETTITTANPNTTTTETTTITTANPNTTTTETTTITDPNTITETTTITTANPNTTTTETTTITDPNTITETTTITTANPNTTTTETTITTANPNTTITETITTTITNPTTTTKTTITTASTTIQNAHKGCLKPLTPVVPEEKCRNTKYDENACRGKEESTYVLYLNGSEWICVTCNDRRSTTTTPTTHTSTRNPTTSLTSHMTTRNPTTSSTSHMTTRNPTTSSTSHMTTPYQATSFMADRTTSSPTVPPPEITFNISSEQNTTNGPQTNTDKVEPQKASENLNKVESLVETMEKANKTNAAIVMGDVIGVLQRQPKDKPTKNISICYSSSQHMINVVESKENTGYPWSVKIPSEAFDKARLENNGSAFVGVLRFINMGNTDEPQNYTVLNNESYGITMGANISNLTDNVDMFFRHNDKVEKGSCVSWDGKGKLKWTTFGCETEINSNSIKCSCSHLTFFAVLMSLPNVNTTAPHLESLTLISSIGCGISMFFMAIALFMHFLLRKAKSNQATKILMNMFVALCLLNASFLSNESVANTEDNTACVFIALVQHYSMLASFTWFFIQALHMYLWLIRQNITITNYMRKITVLGWACAIPIVVAIVSIGGYELVTLNATSGKITRMCWITNPYIYYIVNIGYYALVFVFTTGIFIMIVTKVFEARKIKAVDGKRKTFRKQLMMVLSLFLLFGLTWSVAFFSYGPMIIPSYYIFSVLNSLQGFFLFLYYYHIHNDVEGNFSDDPDSTDSTITLAQSSINTVENIYN
ncbi:hypothetical protein QQF64_010606 [Cirrhinus molitorella]|uniref:Adhesion G-protein coupled receptor G2-like n=1 Tax=Cirrhinus molitorella TaxID=172907 RepID=A0ABR3LWV2_9TELE